ncbi:type IIL restriction-modification enzyme MmeI [Brevundimonas sp.]|uniref:type IIL restriction-modification enzyme MmeI n=1 Tax=Brevundimonas sp. TaxID=1871086 RepID=UPI0028AFF197|nr:type IIL restriction-modification enzyme MmeI [Brevundimonas sp.]
MDVDHFIRVWTNASALERQAAQSFVIQLCRVLGVAAPNDEKVGDPYYGFERIVRFRHDDLSSHWGYIDCYRRECFVLEAKQTAKRLANSPDKQQMKLVGPDVVERKMEKARAQAKGYARALDEWPPFLIMVDVGRSIELWSDFSRMGKTYLQYPDRENYRIALSGLRDPKDQEAPGGRVERSYVAGPGEACGGGDDRSCCASGTPRSVLPKTLLVRSSGSERYGSSRSMGTARGRLCDAVRFRHVCR